MCVCESVLLYIYIISSFFYFFIPDLRVRLKVIWSRNFSDISGGFSSAILRQTWLCNDNSSGELSSAILRQTWLCSGNSSGGLSSAILRQTWLCSGNSSGGLSSANMRWTPWSNGEICVTVTHCLFCWHIWILSEQLQGSPVDTIYQMVAKMYQGHRVLRRWARVTRFYLDEPGSPGST